MKTRGKDSYYTSKTFADILVDFIDFSKVNIVADVCVGGGILLQAAQKKKNNLTCYGTDISEGVLEELRIHHHDWLLDVCDFLDEESRKASVLNGVLFDLILLNPPFTCKGSIICVVFYKGKEYHVSTAMSFLLYSLLYLKPGGELYAIMPISTIYSQKDKKIWIELFKDYKVMIHHESEREAFGSCAPNVVIISIRRGATITPLFLYPHIDVPMNVEIIRGTKNMHYMLQRPGDRQLIHTTSLQNNKIVEDFHVSKEVMMVKGPGVLIPRVGLPKSDKICLMPSSKKCAISDCVILLKTQSSKQANVLKKLILDDWDSFSSLYKGTGAKYITVERVKFYLGYKGIEKDETAGRD